MVGPGGRTIIAGGGLARAGRVGEIGAAREGRLMHRMAGLGQPAQNVRIDELERFTVCAVARQCLPSGCKSRPANSVAPAGSYRSGGGGNEAVGAFETHVPPRRCSESAGRNASEC